MNDPEVKCERCGMDLGTEARIVSHARHVESRLIVSRVGRGFKGPLNATGSLAEVCDSLILCGPCAHEALIRAQVSQEARHD
jgi:uncharacterized Zn finger protein